MAVLPLMRQFVLVYRKAFTLMEVMVAVMIVSLVVGALFKLRGDTSHLFMKLQQEQKQSSLSSLLLWNRDYGLENSKTNLYTLVEDFFLDDDLRRELKNLPISIQFHRIKRVEINGFNLEIGQSTLKTKNFEVSLQRVVRQ